MENLNQNQKAILNFINESNKEFSATQIGVAVGKKNPKNAASWSKPILEELLSVNLISKNENKSKVTYLKNNVNDLEIKPISNFENKTEEISEQKVKNNIYSNLPFEEILKDCKKIVELEENVDLSKRKKSILVKNYITDKLENEFNFSENLLFDKRTLGFIFRIKEKIGLSKRKDSSILQTNVEFVKDDYVEFTAHRFADKKNQKIIGQVTRTFINDYGYRYIVIKNGKKLYTKRDKDVIKI